MDTYPRRGTNLEAVKWQNRAAVLETLWRFQPISRKELADRTELTPATLTNIISEFITAGMVYELGPGESGRGRRPTMLAFISNSAYLVGINLSRDELNVGVFNLALENLHLNTRPITLAEGPNGADMVLGLIRLTIKQSKVDPARIMGVGISAPGPQSMQDGVVFSFPKFGAWSNLPLGRQITEVFGLPAWVENDANANALAEHWLGAGQSYDNFIYVESHSGVGSGIIFNGRLFSGSTGSAGELGHTSVDRNGPRCNCGNYGCVELYSSGPAVVAYVQQAVRDGRETTLIRRIGSQLTHLTFDQVIQAAQDGDGLAVEAIQNASRILALGLVNSINLINPEAVIIGHKFTRAGEISLAPIREVIQQQAFPQATARLDIVLSELREPVGVTGAACCALSGMLQSPNLLINTATLD